MSTEDFKPNTQLLPILAKAATKFGELYNSYEVKGLENLPKDGGVLLVLYHGLVPIDFWYLGLKIYLETGRVSCALVDRWLMKTPGLAQLTKAVGGVSADRETALALLNEGRLVGVSPGGVREAIKGSDQKYQLVWGDRIGFAKLALEAGVPIVPGFTQNVESLYYAPFAGSSFFQKLYEKTRLPLVPIVGLGPLPFPVKLTTWLGEPIHPQKSQTAQSLAMQTRESIEDLISRHQDKP